MILERVAIALLFAVLIGAALFPVLALVDWRGLWRRIWRVQGHR